MPRIHPYNNMNPYLDCILTVGTELSFIPSLQLIRDRRRHFEVFIAVFQLFASVMFSLSKTLKRAIILQSIQWHLLSDILTETYLALICIHLMAFKNEDRMHFLRYLAFGSLIVAKLGDGWDSMFMQTVVLVGFSFLPILHILDAMSGNKIGSMINSRGGTFQLRRLPFKKDAVKPALGLLVAGVLIFMFCSRFDTKRGVNFWAEVSGEARAQLTTRI